MNRYKVVLVECHTSQYNVVAEDKNEAIVLAEASKRVDIEPISTSQYMDTPIATKIG